MHACPSRRYRPSARQLARPVTPSGDEQRQALVVPPDDEIIGFFLYLSDITDELGATRLVSNGARGDIAPDRTHLDPERYGDLYREERFAVGARGSVLAYRATTYHRSPTRPGETFRCNPLARPASHDHVAGLTPTTEPRRATDTAPGAGATAPAPDSWRYRWSGGQGAAPSGA